MITIDKYVRPQSLEEAYQLNQSRRSRILGGMLWLKMGRGRVGTAIDLGDLGLDQIRKTPEGFSIGAMVTLSQLEKDPAFEDYCQGMFADAVKDIVGVQFRNLATVGGSIWGRFGFSDVLTALLAMETSVELYKGGTLSLEEFARKKPDRDILVGLTVKAVPGRFAYQALRIQRTDLPVLNCAVSCLDGKYRAVIGARPERGVILRDEEGLLAQGVTEDSAQAFAEYVSGHVTLGDNGRGSARYRTELTRVLVRRALLEMGGQG